MKKLVIYTLVGVATLAVSGGLTLAISGVNATKINAEVATMSVADPTSPGVRQLSAKRNESVYVMTSATGAAERTFINSTLNTSNEALPVEVEIKYYLDGSEISAAELAGKSGHVKIVYNYSATHTYQGKLVPFLMATALQLDGNKFSNVKLDNGKVISDDGDYMVVGYGFAGMGANLGTDLLPESFTIEADVTDFELGNGYTFATNEIIAELDTSKLTTVDEMVSAINQLSDGLDQIIAGSAELDGGIDSLIAGVASLQNGATALNSGAYELASGMNTLNEEVNSTLIPGLEGLVSGLSALSENSTALNSRVQGTFADLISKLQTICDLPTTDDTTKDYLLAVITSLKFNLPKLYTQLGTYTGTVDYIATAATSMDTSELVDGIAALNTGAASLYAGTTDLKNGVDTLAAGTAQLSSGSKALYSGLVTFKSTGIDKLTSLANDDLAPLVANLRASVSAASSYHSYGNVEASSVKFIFKAPSIK